MTTSHCLALTLALALALNSTPPAIAAADTESSATVVSRAAASAAHYASGQDATPLRELDQLIARLDREPGLKPTLESALVALLTETATPEARLFACQRLAIVGTETSLPALTRLLVSEESTAMACLALANFPSPRAGKALIQALPQLDGTARIQVIQTLGHRQERAAVGRLSTLAFSDDAPTAQAAIVALGRIADKKSARTLHRLRQQNRDAVANALDEAVLRLAERHAATGDRPAALSEYEGLLAQSRSGHVRAGALGALLRLDAEGRADRILKALRGTDPVLVPVAIAAVGTVNSASGLDQLTAELPKLGLPERVLMLESLADLGARCPRLVLAAELDSPHAELRLAALRALNRLNDPASLPLLLRALTRAQTPPERRLTENALVDLRGGAPTDATLIREARQAPDTAKPVLFAALARRGTRSALPLWLAEAGGTEPAVVTAAFQALGQLGTAEELDPMLDRLAHLHAASARDAAEASTAQLLARLPDPDRRALQVTGRLASAPNTPAQCSLLRLLPVTGGEPALEVLRSFRQNPDPTLQDAAVRSLADWPDLRAWPDLWTVYANSTNPAHQAVAIRGLTRLLAEGNNRPSDDQLARYRRVWEGMRRDEDRKLILGALGSLASPDALSLAMETRAHTATRAEADQAVRRIADAIQTKHPAAAKAALDQLTAP